MNFTAATRVPSSTTTSRVLLIGAWFGMVTGLMEGAGLMKMFGHGFTHTGMMSAVSIEIVWISTFLNLALFLIAALVLQLLGRIMPRLNVLRATFAICAFFMFFDWIFLPMKITLVAVTSLSCGLAIAVYRWVSRKEHAAITFIRRTFPAVAVISVLLFVGIQGGSWLQRRVEARNLPPASAEAPNIVLLVVDTLRADHLSTYGYSRPTSPNITEIARQGVNFTSAISPSSWTLPAHASLLTGLLPHEHGADDEGHGLQGHARLPVMLESKGYRTGAFSGNNLFFCRRTGMGDGFIYFDDYFYSLADSFHRTVWGRLVFYELSRFFNIKELPARQRAEEINRRTLDWINQDKSKPFFVFLNYYDLHSPYLPLQPYRRKFSKFANPGGILTQGDDYPDLTPDQLQSEVDAYDGAISYVDDAVKNLMDGLRKAGLDKNTLVVITADHGEAFGEHGLLKHRNALYLPLIRVPLIFWWPGKIPAGINVNQPVSITSIPTTLLDIAGVHNPAFKAPSIIAFVRGNAPGNWQAPVSELTQDPWMPHNYPAYAGNSLSILDSRWHLLKNEKLPTELYNWPEDLPESKNMAREPGSQQVMGDLDRSLSSETATKSEDGELPTRAESRGITGAAAGRRPPGAGK